MDAKKQLIEEKDKLLKKISEAALNGDSQTVLAASEKLNRIDMLIMRYEDLLSDILGLETDKHDQTISGKEKKPLNKVSNNIDTAGRGIGREIRLSFLKEISYSGIHLQHIRGSIYENKSGQKIGIAVATERKADRWFLGLPDKSFDHAVLLCKPEVGDTVELCLPKIIFDEHRKRMSESGGQIKFNIARRGRGYLMLVPGTDGINVSKFIRDYSILK